MGHLSINISFQQNWSTCPKPVQLTCILFLDEYNQNSSLWALHLKFKSSYLDSYMLLTGIVYELSSQCPRGGTTCQDDAVLGVAAPLDEQVSGEATLHVRHTCQDNLQVENRRIYKHRCQLETRTLLYSWANAAKKARFAKGRYTTY